MNSAAAACLFLNAATGVLFLDIVCEQLLAWQFVFLTCLSKNSIRSFFCHWPTGVMQPAGNSWALQSKDSSWNSVKSFLLLCCCDEYPHDHQVRTQTGIWEKTGVLHFLVRSLHAAQTLVKHFAPRFRSRPVDQQSVARLCFLSELHAAEIAARAAALNFRHQILQLLLFLPQCLFYISTADLPPDRCLELHYQLFDSRLCLPTRLRRQVLRVRLSRQSLQLQFPNPAFLLSAIGSWTRSALNMLKLKSAESFCVHPKFGKVLVQPNTKQNCVFNTGSWTWKVYNS